MSRASSTLAEYSHSKYVCAISLTLIPCPGSGHGMPCPDLDGSVAARLPVLRPRWLRCGAACRAPTFPLRHGVPCPDVSAGAQHAVPRRFHCGAACRAPTFPLRRSMPCPDLSAAARHAAPRRLRCDSAIIARGRGTACRAPTFPLRHGNGFYAFVEMPISMCCGAPRRTENRQAGHPFFWYFDAKRGICKWDVGAIATNIAVEYA